MSWNRDVLDHALRQWHEALEFVDPVLDQDDLISAAVAPSLTTRNRWPSGAMS